MVQLFQLLSSSPGIKPVLSPGIRGLFLKRRPEGSSAIIKWLGSLLALAVLIESGYVVIFHYEIASRQPIPSRLAVIIKRNCKGTEK